MNIDTSKLREYVDKRMDSLGNLSDHGYIEDAYHGTSQAEAESILREGFRSPTRPGYFGKAIYFVESNPQAAIAFVTMVRKRVEQTAVLECSVQARKTFFYNEIADIAGQLKWHAQNKMQKDITWEDFGTALFDTLRKLGLNFQSVVWHTDIFMKKNIAVVLAVYDVNHVKARKICKT